jgi:hypothetical protein
MGRGFGNSPEYEPYAHACAKQHGKPGVERKFGLGSIRPKRNIAPSGKNQTKRANKKTGCCQNI